MLCRVNKEYYQVVRNIQEVTVAVGEFREKKERRGKQMEREETTRPNVRNKDHRLWVGGANGHLKREKNR